MNNLSKSEFKKGFTIAEVLIVLAILGLFAVATAAIFSKKHQRPAVMSPHGQFECYVKDDGTVWQRQTNEENMGGEISVGPVADANTKCIFTPPSKRIAYYMVALVGGGASGSNLNTPTTFTDVGGGKGLMKTMFFPEFTTATVNMKPGAGGLMANNGQAVGNAGSPTTFNENIIADGGLGKAAVAVEEEEEGGGGGGGGGGEPLSAEDQELLKITSGELNVVPSDCTGTLLTNSTGYLCLDSTSAISAPPASQAEYTTLKNIFGFSYYNNLASNYASDYWAGALKTCYNKAVDHSWRLPNYPTPSELADVKPYAGSYYYWMGSLPASSTSSYYYRLSGMGSGTRIASDRYTRCVKEYNTSSYNGMSCVDSGKGDGSYLCFETTDTAINTGVASEADYIALKSAIPTMFNYYNNSASTNYVSDYWAASMNRCYNKNLDTHAWRLPTLSEAGLIQSSLYPFNTGATWIWVQPDTSAANGPMMAVGSKSSFQTTRNYYTWSRCVREFTPPPAEDICIDNTLTAQAGDTICIEGNDHALSNTVSSEAKYQALHDSNAGNFTYYINNRLDNYASDYWGGVVERCDDKGSGWKMPTYDEINLFTSNLVVSSFYSIFPDANSTTANYFWKNGGIWVPTANLSRGSPASYIKSRCVQIVTLPQDNDNTTCDSPNIIMGNLCVTPTDAIALTGVPIQADYDKMYTDGLINYYLENNHTFGFFDHFAGSTKACKAMGPVWRIPTPAELTAIYADYSSGGNTLGTTYNRYYYSNYENSDGRYVSGCNWSYGCSSSYNVRQTNVGDHPNQTYYRCVKSYTAAPPEEGGGDLATGEDSGFDSYVNSGGYEFSTLAVDDKTGNGGDAKAAGKPGGILIVW